MGEILESPVGAVDYCCRLPAHVFTVYSQPPPALSFKASSFWGHSSLLTPTSDTGLLDGPGDCRVLPWALLQMASNDSKTSENQPPLRKVRCTPVNVACDECRRRKVKVCHIHCSIRRTSTHITPLHLRVLSSALADNREYVGRLSGIFNRRSHSLSRMSSLTVSLV